MPSIVSDGRIITDLSQRAAGIDPKTWTLRTISNPHHEIHEGDAFFVQYAVADLGAMTTPADAITLTFKTPATKQIHFQFACKGTAGWLMKLVEAFTGAGVSPTGQLTILNKNRCSKTTSLISNGTTAGVVNYDATLVTGGTTLWSEYLAGSGGLPFGGGTEGGARDEIILKKGTKYQLSLYGADANPAFLAMSWYEHLSNE